MSADTWKDNTGTGPADPAQRLTVFFTRDAPLGPGLTAGIAANRETRTRPLGVWLA